MQGVIGFTRVLNDASEAIFGRGIEPNTRVITFTVNHSEPIINRFSVDQDGETPMEKARGTTAYRDMAEFGEKLMFQPMTKYNKGNQLDVRWQCGLNVRAWSFRRLPEDKRRMQKQ